MKYPMTVKKPILLTLTVHFINIGKELAEKFPATEEKCQFVYRITPTIQVLEVNINKLKSDLKSLKPNKASGPDGISSRSLAVAGSSVLDGMLTVFYHSMALSSFPDPWKLAKLMQSSKRVVQQMSLLSIPANS